MRFGIYPDNKTPQMWWGARAIIEKKDINIPYDRQSFEGDKINSDELISWINKTAIPKFSESIKNGIISNISFLSDCGKFHCKADDRNSHGYLYIGCWFE